MKLIHGRTYQAIKSLGLPSKYHKYSPYFMSRFHFNVQIKDIKVNELEDNEFELIYTSNCKNKINAVNILSFAGCVASLVIAPTIIFNPLNLELFGLSMSGIYCIGVHSFFLGVGTSVAINELYTTSMVTDMYHNNKTHDIQIQLKTFHLTNITLNTNLNNMSSYDNTRNIFDKSNVYCSDINKKVFIDPNLLNQYFYNKLSFDHDDQQ
eukprot:73094_1